jgi:hypothetical protein
MRMSMRRFTRLSNGFSKKAANHAHSVAIHFMHYNFVRIHQSLRITPAMAAGVTKTLWSLTDMVRVIEDWEAARSLKISGETMVGRLPTDHPHLLCEGGHAARSSDPYPNFLNVDWREPAVCRDDKHRRSR